MIEILLALLLYPRLDTTKDYKSLQFEPPVSSYVVVNKISQSPNPCDLDVIECDNQEEWEKEETIGEIIERVCQENGFTEVEKLKRIASCESSNDPKVKNPNPNSSATGLFQFTKGTWKDGCKQLGVDWDLEDRKDVEKSTVMTIHFINRGEISRWNETRHCWS